VAEGKEETRRYARDRELTRKRGEMRKEEFEKTKINE
jgi:hypothetical protein